LLGLRLHKSIPHHAVAAPVGRNGGYAGSGGVGLDPYYLKLEKKFA